MQTSQCPEELQQFPWPQILALQIAIREKFKRPDWEIPDEIFKKLFLSAIISDQDSYQQKMEQELLWALNNYPIASATADYVANQLFNVDVIKQYPELEPKEDPTASKSSEGALCATPAEKTIIQDAPGQEISPQPIVDPSPKKLSRGLKWRLDPRWEKLTACAKAIFIVLCLRAIWPKKLTAWPWAFAGTGTHGGLTKEERAAGITEKEEKQGSLEKVTGYHEKQLRRALLQLQHFGFIRLIFRGRPGHGASRYYVFFTPDMSAAYTAIAKTKKRIPRRNKRNSKMS